MNFLAFLQNSQGENSSVRLIMFLYSIVVLFVWAAVSLKSTPMVLAEFPDNVIYVLGLIFGVKGYEKFIENKDSCKTEVTNGN